MCARTQACVDPSGEPCDTGSQRRADKLTIPSSSPLLLSLPGGSVAVSLYECMDDRVNEDSDNITDYLQVH